MHDSRSRSPKQHSATPLPRILFAAAVAMATVATPLVAQRTSLGDIAEYLMPEADEIAMARSSAPFDIGKSAAVWVLTSAGYREAASGSNGWLCFVGRGWSGPIVIGPPEARRLHPDVFDSRLRAPHCLNPAAAQSIWPWQTGRTRLILAGTAADRVDSVLLKELQAGRLRAPTAGSMAYMTSTHQDLGSRFGHWRPHVMIYLAGLTNEAWGIPGFTHDFPFVAETGSPWAAAVVPMRKFSDGSFAEETVRGRGNP